ncbi:efflux RND transporter permease subunit [Mangrovibrevibacter kandeliae]|uniref:efflux RND transporter permease subunit n=1 Tax=Mangrovibrevibacter kandeliae TaxID=2968473 RepID=UPI002118C2A4|nr:MULTISPECIES: efflux RND transporter permease subunit [unclassified Aurantimonas]MCQ8783713.1 efflux RND transporter permease subunit [Aurantimonas sp. CSK15Z-1]MCW4116324.1 efflux RND transporter permease subunit [Aurantimonas sp. MSK8Z-1]
MALFFIRRPVFAWVIAIAIMLAGALALTSLPIAQYPEIAPPTISVTTTYPGADAETIENSVTKVIEQNLNGLDGLDYISSTSSSTGQAQIQLTFKNGTNADTAQIQTQNKVQLITSRLPDAVQNQGITVTKSSAGILLVVGLVSTDGSLSSYDLADFISSDLEDPIRRVDGVGDLQIFGSGYAMRIWLDPEKLDKFQLMPSDVTSAITAQNLQISAGQLGATPSVPGQQMNFTVRAQAQLQTPQQFENIILKTEADGSLVRLGDVARIEVGAESYAVTARYNGQNAAGFGVNLAAGANAIDTAEAVRARIDSLSSTLPRGVEVVYPYDTTPFVELSIEKVVHTLFEAVVLVFVVMFVFLQNFRATLIPTLAIPVVLLGTFGVLAVAGYSINTLTMFAMVLAIGLLVDDAIVVVENVERIMAEEGLPPREATEKSMGEITGALVGIAMVLSAVFLPMAFFGGSVGVIYQQFSITIVTAMLLSVVVALVLTPALCATILKPVHGEKRGLFRWFNRGFDATNRGYVGGVGIALKRWIVMLVAYAAVIAGAAWLFVSLPSSFFPDEDQGVLLTQIQLPVGSTAQRTTEVVKQVESYYRKTEAANVDSVFAAVGFGFSGSGQNNAIVFVRLKDWAQREDQAASASAIARRAMGAFSQLRDAMVFALAPPAVPGLGTSSGFSVYLQDLGNAGHAALKQTAGQLVGKANQDPMLAGVREAGQPDQPQFQIDIDQERAGALGVSVSDINTTLSVAMAGRYVNDFSNEGDIKPVYVQADAPYRMQPSDIERWSVRNQQGQMVPFSAFSSTRWTYGSPRLERYNGVAALNIQGSAAPGVSSGEAMDRMAQLIGDLGSGYGYEWTGLSYQEQISGSQSTSLYLISALVVFLCLAALYESWSIPFAVMLSVPVGILGALAAATLFGQANDIYFKVGLLTTVGLAAKNAILIVEFAKDMQAAGKPLVEATLDAARMRLRPILMTSFAFILGVLPLAIAGGAGAGAQNAIGVAVMGGMLASTVFGVFFVPLLYVLVRRIAGGRNRSAVEEGATEAVAGQS